MKDGSAYGGMLTFTPEKSAFKLDINRLQQVKFVTLPRTYLSFLPYYFLNNNPVPFDINNAESLQISIGLGIPEDQLEDPQGIAIESEWLE